MQQTRRVDLDDDILARVSPQKIKIGSLAKALGHAPKVVAERCHTLNKCGFGLLVTDPTMACHIRNADRLVRVAKHRWPRVQKRAKLWVGSGSDLQAHGCDDGQKTQRLTERITQRLTERLSERLTQRLSETEPNTKPNKEGGLSEHAG